MYKSFSIVFLLVLLSFNSSVHSASADGFLDATRKIGLLVIDAQNDFCEGGSLPVAGGSGIMSGIKSCMGGYDLVVLSQDWHPENHGSFASNHPGATKFTMGSLNGEPQMMWPDHCVQGSAGAKFHEVLGINENPDISLSSYETTTTDGLDVTVVRKGMMELYDSYSAVRDKGGKSTDLLSILRAKGVAELYVCGLATDYCVKDTVLDLREAGITVHLVLSLCRGISETGTAEAIGAMTGAGADVIPNISDIIGG